MKIGYLGPQGTFSEQAAQKYVKSRQKEIDLVPLNSFFDLFQALTTKECDKIIVPIENSIEGSITVNLDFLAQLENFSVEEEIFLKITHYLLAKSSTSLEQITDIFSHPQPLAQCQKYLKTNFPRVKTYQIESTAFAAEMVANPKIAIISKLNEDHFPDKKFVYAAIGSKELAELYKLKILAKNIGDYPNNTTQFFIVGTEKTLPSGRDKTSIIFSTLKDKPGGLYEILGEFAKENINLTRITSRPMKAVLGEYLFFIDFEGHAENAIIKNVLTQVKAKASYFKLLGSYKKDSD
ncbi:MAG: prephenate dehydratase [Candidatus Margulisiibacteriota bacterium]|jgi:prephenate dehydratase